MLKEEYIDLDVDVASKNEILQFICQKALDNCITDNKEALYQDFLNRESEFSTGLQDGFAIPHARTDNIKDIAVMYLKNKNGLEWGTLDESKVNFLFVLLVPAKFEGNVHLKMISQLASCLLEDDFKNEVKTSTDKSKLKDYIMKMMKEVN